MTKAAATPVRRRKPKAARKESSILIRVTAAQKREFVQAADAAGLLKTWLLDEIRPQLLARAGWRPSGSRPGWWIDPQDVAREADERGAFFRVLKDYAAAERLARAAG